MKYSTTGRIERITDRDLGAKLPAAEQYFAFFFFGKKIDLLNVILKYIWHLFRAI